MSKNKSKQELLSEENEAYVKNVKRKSNQYEKCRNEDCDDNDNGFCYKYKNRAKNTCKNYR